VEYQNPSTFNMRVRVVGKWRAGIYMLLVSETSREVKDLTVYVQVL